MANRAGRKSQGATQYGQYRMTGLLVSVSNAQEAQIAIDYGVNLLDMKNPAEGALGRLPSALIQEIVSINHGICRTSATIGDLPMQPELIASEVEKLIETGVEIVKIGFFGQLNHAACALAASEINQGRVSLVAVMMADESPDYSEIGIFESAGFHGVMLDTASKNGKGLVDHLTLDEIREFCELAKQHQLMVGLAGSLCPQDISTLAEMGADYLGFRGAACHESNRKAQLEASKLGLLKEMLHKYNTALKDKVYVQALALC